MSTISAGLVKVTNLTVTGSQSGAVTASNFNFTNLDLSGNLSVDGQLTAPNYSLEELIDYQNMAWRQQFDISDVYTQSYALSKAESNSKNVCLYQAMKYNAECTYTLLDVSGNPTSLLTSATSWTNPKEHDFYGNPSQIVKIEDNGSLSYIDVSGTSITALCKSMVPTNCKTFKTASSSWYKNITVTDSNLFTLKDEQDVHIQMLSNNLKIGIPTQNKSGSRSGVFYNIMFQTGVPNNIPIFGSNNMSIGLDLKPLIDGSGSINFYIQGGINRQVALALSGIDWTGQVTIPPFSIAVTTDAAEYIQKKANGENSVYLNEVLNMLNMNIVDFGDYKSYFPNGNYWDTSGTPIPDSSNSTIISPVSFSCSFGMFRNSVESTSTTSTLRVVSNSNISYTNYDGKKPVQCPLAQVEYLVQVSDTIDFTYNISTLVGLQTISFNRTNKINGVDTCTSFVLPFYGIKQNLNACWQESRYSNEHIGIPYTDGAHVGDNILTPYLDESYGTNSVSQLAFGSTNRVIKDFSGLPDNQQNLDSSGAYNNGSFENRTGNLIHEEFHNITFGLGISSLDFDNNIIDDEYFDAMMLNILYNGIIKDTSGNITRSVYDGIDAPQDVFRKLANGAELPFTMNHGTDFPLTTYGTNLSTTDMVTYGGLNYGLSIIMQSMVNSYDPNIQHFKLMMYYYAKKISFAKNYNIIGLYYKNHGVNPDYTQKTVNPSICSSSFKQGVLGAHLHYNDGSLIANASQLWMETFIMNMILRNNTAIPNKYRSNFTYSWYRSKHSPSCYYGFGNSYFDISSLNMASWDMSQTNEDVNKTNSRLNIPVVPWWPKIISPAGANAYGARLNTFDPSGNMTQDTTYKGICTNVNAFTSDITRHMWSLGGFAYALAQELTSVTATLTEPDTSGTYGGYNTDVSVAVFKYIPECCVTGPRNSKGAFLMKGPYTLSGTGDSKVIDLSGTFIDSPGDGFTVSIDSSGVLTPGMMSFNHIFPSGVDSSGTVYNASTWAKARGIALGMTGNVNNVYQPVTFLVVMNNQIDDFEFDDADVTEKLFLEQIKPSCVNISVTQV